MGHFDYDIFLSFASLNHRLARPLFDQLARSGLRVFWSDETLKAHVGRAWYKEIERSLEASRHMVLLWTDEAEQSDFVELEYTTFHAEMVGDEDRLLAPVLGRGKGGGQPAAVLAAVANLSVGG